jgi:hypothetical protein
MDHLQQQEENDHYKAGGDGVGIPTALKCMRDLNQVRKNLVAIRGVEISCQQQETCHFLFHSKGITLLLNSHSSTIIMLIIIRFLPCWHWLAAF